MAGAVAILSHRGGNIGHDFMALGIEEAVRIAFGADVPVTHFEQHEPLSFLPEAHWARKVFAINHRYINIPRRILALDGMREMLWRDRSQLPYRLAVASGGPNLVPTSHRSPEMRMLLHHLNGAFAESGVPLVDAAVGSAFPLERKPYRFEDPKDAAFYRQALSYVSCIAVREPVAQAVCADLGFKADVIPCAAIGAGRYFEAAGGPRAADGHIVINFQARGANTDWGQGIDARAWRRTVRGVIDALASRHMIRLLAHSPYEVRLAAEIAPELPCDAPRDIAEYAKAIRSAKVAFVSRIHAALALSGIGVPSVVVGTDTRLLTAETIGLPIYPVAQATTALLVDAVENLIADRERQRERLLSLREETLKTYAECFRKHAK